MATKKTKTPKESALIVALRESQGLPIDHACTRCGLCQTSKSEMKSLVCLGGDGKTPVDIMLIGEAPGFYELIEERPFVGDAGKTLTSCLKEAGLERKELYITNVVKCRPPENRKPEPEEIAACMPYLIQEIRAAAPKVIVLLGTIPLLAFTGKAGITKVRGQVITSEELGCQIIPTFHPSYVMRRADDSSLRAKLVEDLVLAKRLSMTGKMEKMRQPVSYSLINTMDELDTMLTKIKEAPVLDFDLETTGSNPKEDKIICISFSVREREAYVLPLWVNGESWWKERYDEVMGKLKILFESDIPKCCQAGSLIDVPFLRGVGIQVAHYDYDTLIMDYLLDENKFENKRSLKDFAWEFTDMGGYEFELDKIVNTLGIDKSTEGLSRIPFEILWKYSATDADVLGRVRRMLYERMEKQELTWLFHTVIMPLANVLIDIEEAGVKIDQKRVEETASEYEQMVQTIDQQLQSHPDVLRALPTLKEMKVVKEESINFNSPDQLRALLFDFLKLPVISRTEKTNKPSTDADVLEKLSPKHEIPKLLLTRKKYHKQVSYLRKTIMGAVDKDGRIHTRYLVHGTETGRLSSRNPNLQNIPRKSEESPIASRVRDVFVAEDGCVLLDADYAQIEFRLLARYSMDERMLDDIRRGVDVHTENAVLVFNQPREQITKAQRQAAKGLTYLMIYGGTAYRVISLFNVSLERAQEIIDMMFTKYPGARKYQQEIIEMAREKQYVTNIWGLRRRVPGILSSDKDVREHNERSAINSPIQSLAAQILYVSMIRISKAFKRELPQARLVLTVHDSLTVECPEPLADKALAIMRREMLAPMPGIKVPLDIDMKVGHSLGSMKKIEKANVEAVSSI